MKPLYSLATVLCVSALAASLLGFVSSHGVTKKLMNIVIGVFVAVCMIAPVRSLAQGIRLDVDFEVPPIEADADRAYNDAVLKQTEANLESRLLALLAENGLTPRSVRTELVTKSDFGVYISKISIYIEQRDRERMKSLVGKVKKEFGLAPVIVICN